MLKKSVHFVIFFVVALPMSAMIGSIVLFVQVVGVDLIKQSLDQIIGSELKRWKGVS